MVKVIQLPSYDYVCPMCNMQLEITRSIHGEIEDVFCPNDSQLMTRRYVAVPVAFNASGFYSTDNGRG